MNIKELQARVDELNAKFRSYDGGDRALLPPVALMQELFDAEAKLGEATRLARELHTAETDFGLWRAYRGFTPSEAKTRLAELQRDLARMCVASERRKAGGE